MAPPPPDISCWCGHDTESEGIYQPTHQVVGQGQGQCLVPTFIKGRSDADLVGRSGQPR